MDTLVHVATIVIDHPILEQVTWAVQIVLAVIAGITAIFAAVQIKHLRQESVDRTDQLKLLREDSIARNDQMKANFLFNMDEMWESVAFASARIAFNKMRNEVITHTVTTCPHLGGEDQQREIAEEFAKRLHSLKVAQIEEYVGFTKLCGFFETAGLLIRKKYIDRSDVIDLYGGSLLVLHQCLEIHLRKEGEGMPVGLFEYFHELAKSIPSS